LLAVSLITACSSSSGDTTSSAGASSAAPTFSGASLNVGIIAPENTDVTNFPGDVGAARAAINAINAKGGLSGHKLNLIYCNDKGDPNQAQICAHQMVSSKVIATVGGASLNDKLIQPILAAANISMLGFNPFFVFNSPNVYLFSGGSFFGYQWLTAYDISHKIKVALVSSDNSTATGLRTTLNHVAQEAGGSFTSTTLVPATASDFSSYVASAQRGNPQAVLLFVGQAQVEQFILAAEQAGSPFPHYQTFGVVPSTTHGIGAAAAKLQEASPFPALVPSSPNPVVREFVSQVKAEAASGDSEAAAANISSHSVGAWLGVIALQKVMQGRTDITAASVSAAFKSATNVDFSGLIPTWNPNAPGPTGFARVVNTAYYLLNYKSDGSATQVTKSAVSLADAIKGNG
jgi:ABC-type branched-subunit amino acid transport system substrate-binding protein